MGEELTLVGGGVYCVRNFSRWRERGISKFLAGVGQLPPIHPVGKDLGIKDESFNLGVY